MNIQEKQIIGNPHHNESGEDWSEQQMSQRKMCLTLNLREEINNDKEKLIESQSECETPTLTQHNRGGKVESRKSSGDERSLCTVNKTTASSIPRQLIDQTISSSPTLARSPAMHEGFLARDWRVERTPINTPDAPLITSRLPQPSDDEEETVETVSVNSETDPISKGSGTSSFLPSSVDVSESKTGSSIPEKENSSKMHSLGEKANVTDGGFQGCRMQQVRTEAESCPCDEPIISNLVQPPADFADSPVKLAEPSNIVEEIAKLEDNDVVMVVNQNIPLNATSSDVISEGQEKPKSESYTREESYFHPELVICQRQELPMKKTAATIVDSAESTSGANSRSSSKGRRKSRSRSRSKSSERVLISENNCDAEESSGKYIITNE